MNLKTQPKKNLGWSLQGTSIFTLGEIAKNGANEWVTAVYIFVIRVCEKKIYEQSKLSLLETASEIKATLYTSRKAHPLDV